MRLSLILLVVSAFALLDSNSVQASTQRHLRSSDAGRLLHAANTETSDGKRLLPNLNARMDEEEEERGLPKTSAWVKLKALRKVERLKEMQEALSKAKVEVKKAADAAKAAAKAKIVAAMVKELDDTTKIKKMLKDSAFKTDVFKTWHANGRDPQIPFNALAVPGKYSARVWDEIAVPYLDFSVEMAKAAARNAK